MADYARLYIFHEGPDDERFLRRVVESRLLRAYDHVDLVEYARKPGGYVRRFISCIDTTPGADYVYLCDLDTVSSVAVRKQAVKDRIPNIDEGKIVVVVPEIEAWYLAGLDEQRRRALGIPYLRATDALTKEQFDNLMPRRYRLRIGFMLEILDSFSLDVAKARNASFRYFAERYGL